MKKGRLNPEITVKRGLFSSPPFHLISSPGDEDTLQALKEAPSARGTLTRYARELNDSEFARKLNKPDWPHPFIIGGRRMGPMEAYLATRYEDLLKKITFDLDLDWTKSPTTQMRPRLTGPVDWIDVVALYIFNVPIELRRRIRQCQRLYRRGRRCPNWFLAYPAHIDDHWCCTATCRKALSKKRGREAQRKEEENARRSLENARGRRAPLAMSQEEYHSSRGFELGKPPVEWQMHRTFGLVPHLEVRAAYAEDCPKGTQERLTTDPEIARIAQLPLAEMKARIEQISARKNSRKGEKHASQGGQPSARKGKVRRRIK